MLALFSTFYIYYFVSDSLVFLPSFIFKFQKWLFLSYITTTISIIFSLVLFLIFALISQIFFFLMFFWVLYPLFSTHSLDQLPHFEFLKISDLHYSFVVSIFNAFNSFWNLGHNFILWFHLFKVFHSLYILYFA